MVYFIKGFKMTKKMTITLEENLINELSALAKDTGKKKTQVVREALQDYFDINSVTKTVQEYKMGTLKTVSHKDVRDSLGL
jgi:metal-responsive CopG/Arc/MetJ family transcriptional regulator